ncbi:hypothetical protein [Acaryochloris sp. CCMEE 5410]|uniref:hypothetical protein n=1 Tax=Acaryochloris sp. CCMEE 5410 TaxID=310037 RepID=UPI000248468D|nr:hypothetical protein [Acaryochloris sp. CCMEE 5410]KAI9134029.1 hypothetical protein ON05_012530 [Acaryochloris sp. CCMEE 5410]
MFIERFWLGFVGAIVFEIIKLYEMMGKLESKKFRSIMTSKIYWIMIIMMAAASGFIAWGINDGYDNVSTWQVIMSGIGARTLVTKPIELNIAHKNTELGDKSKISLKDIYS